MPPDAYDGSSSKLRTFLDRSSLYLDSYRNASEEDKAIALGTFLTGPALRVYTRLRQSVAPQIPSVDVVYFELKRHFGDQNEASDARLRFQRAQQRTTESVLAFYHNLCELVDTPGCEDLRSPVSMMERLWTGMHASLQRMCVLKYRELRTVQELLHLAQDAERMKAREFRREVPAGSRPAHLRAMSAHEGRPEDYADPWVVDQVGMARAAANSISSKCSASSRTGGPVARNRRPAPAWCQAKTRRR